MKQRTLQSVVDALETAAGPDKDGAAWLCTRGGSAVTREDDRRPTHRTPTRGRSDLRCCDERRAGASCCLACALAPALRELSSWVRWVRRKRFLSHPTPPHGRSTCRSLARGHERKSAKGHRARLGPATSRSRSSVGLLGARKTRKSRPARACVALVSRGERRGRGRGEDGGSLPPPCCRRSSSPTSCEAHTPCSSSWVRASPSRSRVCLAPFRRRVPRSLLPCGRRSTASNPLVDHTPRSLCGPVRLTGWR